MATALLISKIIAVHLAFIIFVTGIVKLFLSFKKRDILFWPTVAWASLAAFLGQVIAYIIYKNFAGDGLYINELPPGVYIVHYSPVFIPLILIVVVFMVLIRNRKAIV